MLMKSQTLSTVDSVRSRYIAIKHPKMRAVLRIQDEILTAIRDFLRGDGFVEVLAPIIGPVTDPGIRGAKQVLIDYYGTEFRLMSSMILYKQMAVSSLGKIFSLSPNIRIEPAETLKTKRHLAEFRQVDIEEAFASYEDSMSLGERLVVYVCKEVKLKCGKELGLLKRDLRIPAIPFKKLSYHEAVDMVHGMGFENGHGEEIPWEAEEALSAKFKEPFWITCYPLKARGFYYLEDTARTGLLRDMDLILPDGYGEVVSGGEREHTYERVLKRLKASGEDPKIYKWYLEMLRYGIPPSAGFGIGVERLTRWVCGLDSIWEAVPFPKVPGIASL